MAERRPDPEPLHTNDTLTVTVGTALWALLLVGLLVFHDAVRRGGLLWWYPMCLCGLALGAIGLVSTRRRAKTKSRPDPTEVEL